MGLKLSTGRCFTAGRHEGLSRPQISGGCKKQVLRVLSVLAYFEVGLKSLFIKHVCVGPCACLCHRGWRWMALDLKLDPLTLQPWFSFASPLLDVP